MKRNLDILTLLTIALLTSTAMPAEAQSGDMPRLIVGINVDQLRPDYLHTLQDRLLKDGLNKLIHEGVFMNNVVYEMDSPSSMAAMATINTGCYPYQHGVTDRIVFDVSTLHRRSVFYDPNYLGNGTPGLWSPRALATTTLSDELMRATQYRSNIYSIAPNAEEAILNAGHAANCAVWIDDETGKWVSTTFYKDYPAFISKHNDKDEALFVTPKGLNWSVAADINAPNNRLVPHLREKQKSFSHSLSKGDKLKMFDFKTSALVNHSITEFAKFIISNKRLGYSNITDMLQITYYAGSYLNEAIDLYPDETQEIYLDLDRQIAQLLEFIDKEIGLQNTLIYVTGTGDTNNSIPDISGMNTGEFNASRCTALLNSCLISIYGQGQWVDGYDDGQIYLNRKFIEKQGKKLTEVTQEAADFVSMMSGVDEVFTRQQLIYNDYSDRITRTRNAYSKNTGGDIIIKLQAGWNLRLDNTSKPKPQQRNDAQLGMAIIFAPSLLKPTGITAPVEAVQIAPTVAKCLKIRAPSACSASGINL